MTRRLATGGPWERPVGYGRAVAAGDFVFVSGCEYGRADGAAFGQILPASSMIGITALIDSRMLVEVEVEVEVEAVAYKPGIGD